MLLTKKQHEKKKKKEENNEEFVKNSVKKHKASFPSQLRPRKAYYHRLKGKTF